MKSGLIRGIVCAVSLAFLSVPQFAYAKWMEASSPHFVIYSDDTPKRLKTLSENLEKFHSAMTLITGFNKDAPSPSNRVQIYVLNSEGAIRTLFPEGGRYLGGIYLPRAGQSFAFVPRRSEGWVDEVDLPLQTLMHEYVHHFLMSGSNMPLPRWLGEGLAEFYSSVRFKSNGDLHVGVAAQTRAYELFGGARPVTVNELFDPALYEKRSGKGYDAFYGRAWLLTHYLFYSESRRGQEQAYLTAIAKGVDQVQAARDAFGDFPTLDRELSDYMKKPIPGLVLAANKLSFTAPVMRDLRPGEIASIPWQIRSRRGVNSEEAAKVVVGARAVAAQYPDDPVVMTELAEAEYDAGNDAPAIAAADAAIGRDPSQARAHVQKGYALFRRAQGSGKAEDYQAARTAFVTLNHLENDNPIPLIYFYRWYTDQGKAPTPLAVRGLQRAVQLAPFDLGLRTNAGMQAIHDGDADLARWFLRPVAFYPHGGSLATEARGWLDRLEKDPAWRGEGATVEGDETESS